MRNSGEDFGLQLELFIDKSEANLMLVRRNGKILKWIFAKKNLYISLKIYLQFEGIMVFVHGQGKPIDITAGVLVAPGTETKLEISQTNYNCLRQNTPLLTRINHN